MGRRSLGAVVATLAFAGAADALNPQPLPPGFVAEFKLNFAKFVVQQGAVGGATPTVHTEFAYRDYPPEPTFTPPDPCEAEGDCALARGRFDVSAPDVDLARAAGLAAAVAGSACVDQATLSAALASAGATLLTYEPPDPCFRAAGGNPAQVALALDAGGRALGVGGNVLAIFDEIVDPLLNVPSCRPTAAP